MTKKTHKEIEIKLYLLRKLGFDIRDKIYMRAIKQKAFLEYGKKRIKPNNKKIRS